MDLPQLRVRVPLPWARPTRHVHVAIRPFESTKISIGFEVWTNLVHRVFRVHGSELLDPTVASRGQDLIELSNTYSPTRRFLAMSSHFITHSSANREFVSTSIVTPLRAPSLLKAALHQPAKLSALVKQATAG